MVFSYIRIMKFTVSVPDKKAKTFVQFLKTIDYVNVEENKDFVVPEWHKKLVLKRIKNSKPEDYIPLDKAMKKLKKELGI